MSTTYKGIDYSLGKSNRNTTTGIRFGVMPANAMNPDATDDIWQHGRDLDYEEYIAQVKSGLRSALEDYFSDSKWGDAKTSKLDDAVENAFDAVSDGIGDAYQPDCATMLYEQDGYRIQNDCSGDIWAFESPYFTYAQFCSPCAPGACYLQAFLMNPDPETDQDNRAYCFGHDWFDDGKAPYPVYSVATGQLVNP